MNIQAIQSHQPDKPDNGCQFGFELGYRPALDGLRAVGVLAVMLHHTQLLSGGFLGVDVFFVLSGFLITSLLLEEHARAGRVSLRGFYTRRALRLLPALAPVVVVGGSATIAWSPDWDSIGFVLSVLFYVANWALVAGHSHGLLVHTWSLAIEEQFYILWPVGLLLLLRVTRRRILLALLLAAAAPLAVAYRFWTVVPTASDHLRLYVGLDTHADPLLIGCTLGLFCHSALFKRTRAAAIGWNVAGVVAVPVLVTLFLWSRFPIDYAFASVSTWTALATAVLIAATLAPGSPFAWLLAQRPLTWIGKRSYALYLWHYPVFFVAVPDWLDVPKADLLTVVAAWAIAFTLAAASFRYIEAPALRWKATLSASRAPAALRREKARLDSPSCSSRTSSKETDRTPVQT